MNDSQFGEAAVPGKDDHWEARLENLLSRLEDESPETSFNVLQPSAWHLDNVLSRSGAEAALAIIPSWTLGDDGSELRLRLELETSNDATAMLAALRALTGEKRHPTRTNATIRDRTVELAIRAPEVEGIPVWVLAIALQLDELLREPTEEQLEPASLSLILDLSQEEEWPWRFRPEHDEIGAAYFFDTSGDALTFATQAMAVAQLRRALVSMAVDVDGEIVQVRLSNAAGGALTTGTVEHCFLVREHAVACGTREPRSDAQLLAALTAEGVARHATAPA